MSAPKTGVLTSEFWQTTGAQVVGGLAATGATSSNPWVQLAGLVVSAFVTWAYNTGRAKVKAASMGEAFGAKPVKL